MNLNYVAISGNITRDPELKSTASGLSVLTFSVAVNDRTRNRDGEWEDYPNFVDCTMFGNAADGLAKVLSKGTKVAVGGKLHFSKWEDNGKTRSKLEVYPHSVDIIGSKRSDSSQTGSFTAAAETAPQNGSESLYDDEIPF